MRIVAGSARGRVLEGPGRSTDIRPTADRVRETLYNILGQWFDGQRVLDLYAGTGALGLEAVSRGASTAVLVDQAPEAVRLCRANVATLGFGEQVEVLAMSVERAAAHLRGRGAMFDLILADPPYAVRGVEQVVTAAAGPSGRRDGLAHARWWRAEGRDAAIQIPRQQGSDVVRESPAEHQS